jgi:hypothetical protein
VLVVGISTPELLDTLLFRCFRLSCFEDCCFAILRLSMAKDELDVDDRLSDAHCVVVLNEVPQKDKEEHGDSDQKCTRGTRSHKESAFLIKDEPVVIAVRLPKGQGLLLIRQAESMTLSFCGAEGRSICSCICGVMHFFCDMPWHCADLRTDYR